MQSEAYARKVKISNLQKMAETLVYVQEHEYGRREEVVAALEQSKKDLETSVSQLEVFSSQMKTLNSQIHYTGQYYASKNTYYDYLKTRNKNKFHQTHETKIQQERVSVKNLETVLHNIDAILNWEAVFTHEHTRKSQEYPNNNYIKKQKEETL